MGLDKRKVKRYTGVICTSTKRHAIVKQEWRVCFSSPKTRRDMTANITSRTMTRSAEIEAMNVSLAGVAPCLILFIKE